MLSHDPSKKVKKIKAQVKLLLKIGWKCSTITEKVKHLKGKWKWCK